MKTLNGIARNIMLYMHESPDRIEIIPVAEVVIIAREAHYVAGPDPATPTKSQQVETHRIMLTSDNLRDLAHALDVYADELDQIADRVKTVPAYEGKVPPGTPVPSDEFHQATYQENHGKYQAGSGAPPVTDLNSDAERDRLTKQRQGDAAVDGVKYLKTCPKDV